MPSDSIPHVLTIDLEDWFHCMSPEPTTWREFQRRAEVSTEIVLELLKKCGARATFFVLGDVARSSRNLVQRIADSGHEVGTHGLNHKFIYQQTPDEFRKDLKESIGLLEEITGQQVLSYRAPYFSITSESLWALDILAEVGITCDSSIFPIRNPRYGIPDAKRTPHEIRPGLREWPISTVPTFLGNIPFCGGFYFRFLPGVLIQKGVRHLENRSEPVVVYLHPWEFDPDQPRYRTSSRFLNFRHYYRLSATSGKLESLMTRSQFISLSDAEKLVIAEAAA